METWYEASMNNVVLSEEQKSIIKAIRNTIEHFEMEDYLYGSNHIQIINDIYLSTKYEKSGAKSKKKKRIMVMTKNEYAQKFYLDPRTLSIYTNYYIKCFEKNINDLKELK